MTVLPRITISPIVVPSAGTSFISVSTTRTGSAVTMATPCRDCGRARSSGVPSHQIGCGSLTV